MRDKVGHDQGGIRWGGVPERGVGKADLSRTALDRAGGCPADPPGIACQRDDHVGILDVLYVVEWVDSGLLSGRVKEYRAGREYDLTNVVVLIRRRPLRSSQALELVPYHPMIRETCISVSQSDRASVCVVGCRASLN